MDRGSIHMLMVMCMKGSISKEDKINGQGKYTYANGNVYEGDWKEDKMNGRGTLTWTNGNVYVGEWKENKINGQDKKTSATGHVVHEGKWTNNDAVK